MEKTKTFEELLVYKITESFPRHEIFGLTSQFRSAAVSIAANIAKGYKKKDFKNKLNSRKIAHFSLEECRYYIILSRDLNYQNENALIELIDETGKPLNAYSKAIASSHCIS
jgi:four helix bundle protein